MSMEQGDSGLSVLRDALASDVFTEVIVLTAYGNVANAVESMRRGAFDYLEKNVPGIDVYELLALKIGQAMERRRTAVGTIRRLEQFVKRI
jgi:Response regulator containing CheY-like receiver, AAA-type ATPase, and DNA-binding domains